MIGLYVIIFSTIVCLILAILLKPEIKLKNIKIETFWLVAFLGAFFLGLFGYISLSEIEKGLFQNQAMNPFHILILFLAMTIISVVLDELNFFRFLAAFTLKKANGKVLTLFFYLYLIVSILTVFTSNDIVILTFTPFICYFAKYAKINPIPFLFGEFIGANSWSMMFIIGNPTNIYLATSYGLDFFGYFQIMILPTIMSSLFALGLLLLLFRKDLIKKTMEPVSIEVTLKNKHLTVIALVHLGLCTILLSLSSYFSWEMWSISLFFVLSLLLCVFIDEVIIQKRKPAILLHSLKRAPWTLAPFVLSMFIFVIALKKYDITSQLYQYLTRFHPIYGYGITSLLTSNIINNIPMTVLYSEIIANFTSPVNQLQAIFASIIGSNLGAFLTPVGALAGIMWLNILHKENIKFGFTRFVRYGLFISLPTLLVALFILMLIM